jgi:hypothetical protein
MTRKQSGFEGDGGIHKGTDIFFVKKGDDLMKAILP